LFDRIAALGRTADPLERISNGITKPFVTARRHSTIERCWLL
jgi:hypothetical protein